MSGLTSTLASIHDFGHKIDPLDKAVNKAVLGTDNPWRTPEVKDPGTTSVVNSVSDDGTGKATSTRTTLYGTGSLYSNNEKLRTSAKSSTTDLLGS